MQEPQRRLAARRFRMPQIAREAEEANRLRGEVMPQRRFLGVLRTPQEVRQTLLPIEHAQAGRQIDPVPGLVELIAAESAMQLAFEDTSGRVGADLRERANLINELGAGTQVGFDAALAFALEEQVQSAFDVLDGLLVEFARLKD